MHRKRLDPDGKIPASPDNYLFSGMFSSTFDQLKEKLAVAKLGTTYFANPYPFFYSVEFRSPKIFKAIFQDPRKFPKLTNFFPSGSVMEQIIGQSLVAVEGEKWRTQRKNLDPAFKRSYLANMIPQFHKLGENLVSQWEKNAGAPFAIQEYFVKLALDAVGNFI